MGVPARSSKIVPVKLVPAPPLSVLELEVSVVASPRTKPSPPFRTDRHSVTTAPSPPSW